MRDEARQQKDWESKPRMFLAMGTVPAPNSNLVVFNGEFLDPFLNLICVRNNANETQHVSFTDEELSLYDGFFLDEG
jgi:hypothetical protein